MAFNIICASATESDGKQDLFAASNGGIVPHETRDITIADSNNLTQDDVDAPASIEVSHYDDSSKLCCDCGCGWTTASQERFDAIARQCHVVDDEEEPEYGHDELILDFQIHDQEIDRSHYQQEPPRSEIWVDQAHRYRTGEPAGENVRYAGLTWEIHPLEPGKLATDPDNCLKRYTLDPIDLETWEFRLLLLFPHKGEKTSPLRARIVRSMLTLHSCFTAVRNTRGNIELKGSMYINEQEWEITKNLETFLLHVRSRDECRVLWIREICIDKCRPEERRLWYHWRYQRMVENCSCGVLLMDQVMEELDYKGILAKPLKTRKKLWDEPIAASDEPRHCPSHLGRYFDEDTDYGQFVYKYLPLDLVADEIRVVVLHFAEAYFAPLTGYLAHIPLYGNVAYTALSYTWGNSSRARTIRLNGQIMMIAKNLEDAMRVLRKKGRLVVWIDAVSINQEDEREKSRQIPRMQEIYEQASGVFSCVGPNTKVIQSGLRFVQELGIPDETAFQTCEDKTIRLKHTPRLAKAWAALYEVLRQPFFRRRWIVQEIAAANLANVIEPAGGKPFHWNKLYNAASQFEFRFQDLLALWRTYYSSPLDQYSIAEAEDIHGFWKSHRESPFETYRELAIADYRLISELGLDEVLRTIRSIKILSYVRHLRVTEQPPSFLHLLILAQTFECSDDRDRIYALWNIANDSKHLSVRPDYSMSTAEVYMQFAKAYCEHRQSLDIICTHQCPFSAASTPEMPMPLPLDGLRASWCPDWRQDPRLHTFVRKPIFGFDFASVDEVPFLDVSPYHANHRRLADHKCGMTCHRRHSRELSKISHSFAFADSDLLASGAILDTIAHVSEWPYRWHPMYKIAKDWQVMARKLHRNPDGSQPTPDETATAFFSMMIGMKPSSVTSDTTDESRYCIRSLTSELMPLESNIYFPFMVREVIKGRRFFITEKGYMGLAPWYARVGFKIAVLLDCSVPVVLEWIEDVADGPWPEGWYFRGDCFVQGWMEGEMMEQFGHTDEEAWRNLIGREKIRIH